MSSVQIQPLSLEESTTLSYKKDEQERCVYGWIIIKDIRLAWHRKFGRNKLLVIRGTMRKASYYQFNQPIIQNDIKSDGNVAAP